jgi:F-type H+-transporting ATPase subunit b
MSPARHATLVLLFLCAPLPALAAGGGINLNPDWGVVARNILVFLLLVIPVNKLLLQPLLEVLRAREERTEGATERAGEIRDEAASVESELASQIADARARAQGRRGEILAEAQVHERGVVADAQSRAATQIDAVRAGIAEELDSARQSLRAEARELAREAAASILGRAI